MESQEVSESVRVSDNSGTSGGDGLEQVGSGVNGSENLGVNLLEDLDSYLEDIDDRLMISRMVSDSVIKGMVNAVEQEATEKIATKELEVASLKESLRFFHVGRFESSGSPVILESESIDCGRYLSFVNACVEHDKMRELLSSLRNAASEQFERLQKDIEGIRGCSSMRRIGSGSELVGLGGILKEKESETWVGVDRTVDSLKTTLDTICTRVDDLLQLSKTSLCEWRQDQEFREELEAMVMQSSIRSLQEDFEEKLWDQNARFCGSQSVNWFKKFNEISSLRKELDAISKLLYNPETGQLISHGSCDVDHSLRKNLNNHASSSSSLWEGNGKVDESKTGVPESFDPVHIKHMSKEDLVNYFNTMIRKIKRDHESTVQQMTEEYFSLKGKYLNERGSSLPLRKDKEFDMLRKKIPEILVKLDLIIVENEKLPAFSDNAESLGSLKDRLDSLLSENRQLRDLLTDKKNEVKCLSSQVFDAAEKMLQHSSAEANLLKLVENLKSSMQDASIEASVHEEVYKCVLREQSEHIKTDTEESEMEFIIMKEIFRNIFAEAAHNAETTSKCEIEDSDMESLIVQGICGILFIEFIKDAEGRLKELYKEYLIENKIRDSLKMEVTEKEDEVRLEVEEKERLKKQVLLLEMLMVEKEKLATEVSAALKEEKEQFELASQELDKLGDHINQQQTSISEISNELDLAKGKLVEFSEQIEVDKMEINTLLELAMKELKEAKEQKKIILALMQEKQNDLSSFEAKEKEHRKQMEATVVLVDRLSKTLANFECRVAEDIKTNNLRLKHSSSQLSSLIKKANILTRTGLLYKQRLERRCSDLQMAEAEVDLLGDEVEALLSLLEKIYIALDHYSPILQHYPGIIDILKLVRRELSGERTNPV